VPRPDIRMSSAEVAAFLAAHSGCVLGYNDGGPAPAVLAGTYTVAGQALRVSAPAPGPAASVSDSAAALRRDPRVCLIVEQSPSYYEIGYVTLEGSAEHIREAADGLTFVLTPHRVTSASFAKLSKPAG
jgi:nitroimidazol reductase NimA-like FMN-containing flavoprotein (pyridoxamine 5'-phosphate oxidase superfamily)